MIKIGFSRDIHKIVKGRDFILGGIKIPADGYGLYGHSDADVLLHAIAESILGALSLGDLGTYFPDNDEKYYNTSSIILLNEVLDMMRKRKFRISNIDTLIVLDFIKLKPYVNDIKVNLMKLLNINEDQISIKCSTNEGFDSVGKKEACVAYSNVLLESYE